jgi:hypothetical protein
LNSPTEALNHKLNEFKEKKRKEKSEKFVANIKTVFVPREDCSIFVLGR